MSQAREIVVDHVAVALHVSAAASNSRGGYQVFIRRQVLKHTAALQYLDNAKLDAVLWCDPIYDRAHELDVATGDLATLRLEQAADGLE